MHEATVQIDSLGKNRFRSHTSTDAGEHSEEVNQTRTTHLFRWDSLGDELFSGTIAMMCGFLFVILYVPNAKIASTGL